MSYKFLRNKIWLTEMTVFEPPPSIPEDMRFNYLIVW